MCLKNDMYSSSRYYGNLEKAFFSPPALSSGNSPNETHQEATVRRAAARIRHFLYF